MVVCARFCAVGPSCNPWQSRVGVLRSYVLGNNSLSLYLLRRIGGSRLRPWSITVSGSLVERENSLLFDLVQAAACQVSNSTVVKRLSFRFRVLTRIATRSLIDVDQLPAVSDAEQVESAVFNPELGYHCS